MARATCRQAISIYQRKTPWSDDKQTPELLPSLLRKRGILRFALPIVLIAPIIPALSKRGSPDGMVAIYLEWALVHLLFAPVLALVFAVTMYLRDRSPDRD